jgi:LysM repeat protein
MDTRIPIHWIRWIVALSGLWGRHARTACRVFRWGLPGVSVAVLILTLVGSATALAAGSGRTPVSLVAQSPLPTPTNTPVPSTGFYYTVQRGDTLSSIARRYSTTVQAIVQANGIVNPNLIFYGQRLWIPSSPGPGPGPSPTVYIVRAGDTLYAIARRYGTTYQALAALNGLHYPYTIYVGQRLLISGSATPPASGRIHIVQRGETLWAIALRYGTTPWAIASANGLWNVNLIYVGQRLVIP